MIIEDLLKRQKKSKYRLAKEACIPHSTLSDICKGNTKLEKCSAETLYKLARSLGVTMEVLTEAGLHHTALEQSYECGLPGYLQEDLDAYKHGLTNGSKLMDCLWGELYGSINVAEISEQSITHDHAAYLREKYLWDGVRK